MKLIFLYYSRILRVVSIVVYRIHVQSYVRYRIEAEENQLGIM